MNKLSKILIAAFAVVAFTASTASAAYTHTTFLKQGSKGASVMELQKTLNMTSCQVAAAGKAGSPGMETSYFGPATTAAVKCFQSANGLVADGLVGKNTGAALAAVTGGSTGGLPAGCTSTSGYSPVTGQPCNSGSGSGSLPAGCTSTAGYSPVTGQPCAGGTGSQTGPITASLSATTPAASYIIDSQATAGLLDVNFMGNGTVNSVTLARSGISDQNTLSNVYLYDGANRLTDGYSFNSAGQIVINNLNLSVNGSKTISVKADVASNASSTSATIAVALTGFTSGTSVNSVNIQGNLMNTASGSSLATASLSANTVVGSPTVNAGTSAFTFWSAPLQINTRTVWLKSASFRMVGSAPSDAVANIKLYVDGVDTGANGTVIMMNGSNYVVFDLMSMPKSLTTGSHTLDVRGNIEKGSSRTVQFSLQQAADLMITDPQVGVNLAVSGTVPNNGATVSINAGSLTINNDPTFQTMTNVTGGASNVTIAKFKLHAYGEDVKVNSIVVDPEFTVAPTTSPACTNNTNCSLDDVTLYFNGSQVGTQQDWTGLAATDLTYNLGSQLIVPAGTDSYLEVRANVRTSSGANYTAGTVRANLVVGSSNAQGQNSFTTISTPAVTGTSLSIQTGLLAVSKNTGYANQTVTPNTAGVKIGSFVFQNQSSSESVRVTSLSAALGFTGSQSLTNLSALRTSETSGSGATPVQPQATNTFSVDFTLAPGATKTIDVLADTGSTTTGTIIVTLGSTSIGASSNVTQTVSSITGQTITVNSGAVTNPPTLVTASATSAQYIAAGMGGSADATVAAYNFVSTGGASTISELKFTVTASAGTPISSIKVGSMSAPVVSGVAYLTGLNLMVPQGGSGLTQDVFISYSEVGTNGTVPGTTASVALTEVKYTSGGTTTVFNPSPSVSAPTMTLVGSKPTLSVPSTQATGLIIGAENKIGEVTVSADAKGNIKLNDISFAMGSSNITTFAITAPRIADGTTTITGSGCVANAATTTIVFCEFGTVGNTFATGAANTELNTDFDGYTIAAGTSKTFSLYGVVGGTITTGGGNTTVSSSVSASAFNWDDASYPVFVADATPASPANGTNLSGSSIYNFPTNSYSIKQ